MKEFDELVKIADRLLGPDGCPWDRVQTFFTLQPYLLEETHELIDAIDQNDAKKIAEELGDVLYTILFIAKLGEKGALFTFESAIRGVAEKLIRRHPHIFGEVQVDSMEEISQNWEKIKKQEGKKHPLEGIPPTLPALARAQKVLQKLKKAKNLVVAEKNSQDEEMGQKLWELIREADALGIDAESALRRTCLSYEEIYRRKKNTGDDLVAQD